MALSASSTIFSFNHHKEIRLRKNLLLANRKYNRVEIAIKTDSSLCKKLTIDANAIFSTTNDRRECSGILCDSIILYNSDLGLSTAIFDWTQIANVTSTKSNTCTKLTYANINCNTIDLIEKNVTSEIMVMVRLNGFGNQNAGDAWELQALMHIGFEREVWQQFEILTNEYKQKYGQLLIVSGSIFDYNYDGLTDNISIAQTGSSNQYSFKDISIPTHYYRIIIRCVGQWKSSFVNVFDSCQGKLESLSFILPNTPKMDNCMAFRDYLRMHMSRIRDIELLTDIEFFQLEPSDNKFYRDALRLRTRITEDIW